MAEQNNRHDDGWEPDDWKIENAAIWLVKGKLLEGKWKRQNCIDNDIKK